MAAFCVSMGAKRGKSKIFVAAANRKISILPLPIYTQKVDMINADGVNNANNKAPDYC